MAARTWASCDPRSSSTPTAWCAARGRKCAWPATPTRSWPPRASSPEPERPTRRRAPLPVGPGAARLHRGERAVEPVEEQGLEAAGRATAVVGDLAAGRRDHGGAGAGGERRGGELLAAAHRLGGDGVQLLPRGLEAVDAGRRELVALEQDRARQALGVAGTELEHLSDALAGIVRVEPAGERADLLVGLLAGLLHEPHHDVFLAREVLVERALAHVQGSRDGIDREVARTAR